MRSVSRRGRRVSSPPAYACRRKSSSPLCRPPPTPNTAKNTVSGPSSRLYKGRARPCPWSWRRSGFSPPTESSTARRLFPGSPNFRAAGCATRCRTAPRPPNQNGRSAAPDTAIRAKNWLRPAPGSRCSRFRSAKPSPPSSATNESSVVPLHTPSGSPPPSSNRWPNIAFVVLNSI